MTLGVDVKQKLRHMATNQMPDEKNTIKSKNRSPILYGKKHMGLPNGASAQWRAAPVQGGPTYGEKIYCSEISAVQFLDQRF